jgi:hypothetical protein
MTKTLILAKSAWPKSNTGKTLAEVFKTQPATTTIPILAEKPNVQTSATPPKPASIASDKDAPGAAKPASRVAQNPGNTRKTGSNSTRQKAAAPQPKRQSQQESAVFQPFF